MMDVCWQKKTPHAWHAGFRISQKSSGLILVFLLLAQSRAENVAERCARIRRSVLSNGFLLFRNLECLDRHRQLARLLVEDGDASIDLLADGEALWTLLVTVTREVG